MRKSTDLLKFEIEMVLRTKPHNHLFFVGSPPPSEQIPGFRCFNESGLLEALQHLYGDIGKALRKKPLKISPSAYKDKKNGYFSYSPPTGWELREYNDIRTKVEFENPDSRDVSLMFIVREAADMDFNAMVYDDVIKIGQLRSMGVSCRMTQETLGGYPCVKFLTHSEKFGNSVIWKYLANGLKFVIQYHAQVRDSFDRYYHMAATTLETIKILNTGIDTGTKPKEQSIANYVRVARLMAEHVGIAEAEDVLAKGKAQFPDSQLINQTLEELRAILRNRARETKAALPP